MNYGNSGDSHSEAVSTASSPPHIMKENKMNGSDLGRLLGHRALGSAILRGHRRLTVAPIQTLAKRFKVDGSLFL